MICTVRACGLPLSDAASGLRCPAGHSFDRARSGFFNLLQPQDRRSAVAGDRIEAVRARRRWLERGFALELAELVGTLAGLEALPAGAAVLDVGCGEGWFDERWVAGLDVDLCGIDLSTHALRLAARRLPRALWVVANADRGLPLATASVDVALSIFGRRPFAELARVIRPGGRLVVALPAEDDLAQLRRAAQGRSIPRDRLPRLAEEWAPLPFRLDLQRSWRRQATHDRAAIGDALAMTYRGQRVSERARLEEQLTGAEPLEVTLAAEVCVLVRDAT